MQVQGKRTRKPTASSSDMSDGSAGRGRRMKAPSQLKSRRTPSSRKAQYNLWLSHQDTKIPFDERRLSLETLPAELIQNIFFFALEVNLPRASPHLRKVLSKDSIYNALILLAYFDPNPQRELVTGGDYFADLNLLHWAELTHQRKQFVDITLFLPARYQLMTRIERLSLQKDILSCKWCDYNRIKSCLPALTRLQMMDHWYWERCVEFFWVHDKAEDKIEPLVPSNPSYEIGSTAYDSLNNEMNDNPEQQAWSSFAPLPRADDLEAMGHHYFSKCSLPNWSQLKPAGTLDPEPKDFHQSAEYLPRILVWNHDDEEYDPKPYKYTNRYRSTLSVIYIPDYLIDGTSWSEENVAFLRLLRQGYRFSRWDHDEDGEFPLPLDLSTDAMFNGMRKAVQSNQLEMLKILLELLHAFSAPRQGEHYSYKPLYSIRTFPHVPLEVFHLATEQVESSQLIELLIRASIDSIPNNDTVLTRWALRDNGEVARWLLEHMERPQHQYGCYSIRGANREMYLFRNGALQPRWQAYPFPTTTFSQELGYSNEFCFDELNP